ncbi:MAG: IS3 family transposase [Kiritimatiellae bacterium]|nr:IS3 family transposase [Kiritimatiellia bacterium]
MKPVCTRSPPHRKAPRTTESSHGGPIAPNLLKSMEITHANQAWAMDITYVHSGQGWVYLAAVLDLYLHKIVGWQLGDHMESSLVTDALQMAAQRQGWPAGVVVHSDRGSQYASEAFIQRTEAFGFIRSMSARGNCYDNATMESFFGVIKREELNRWEMPDLAAVRYRVFDYIETYYNRRRIHTALGMSPAAFEGQSLPKTPSSSAKASADKSAEFSEASLAPQVGNEKAGEMTPRPRPVVAISTYPSASCSPAEARLRFCGHPIHSANYIENQTTKATADPLHFGSISPHPPRYDPPPDPGHAMPARSTRPLAWGEFAGMTPTANVCMARSNCVWGP